MKGKVIKVVIDHREYLFKLGSEEEIDHLRELASFLEKRIQINKRGIVTTDYTKVLILTCLDLLEEIHQSQNKNDRSKPSSAPPIEKQMLKRIVDIHSLLKNQYGPTQS